ncbi:MAG: hypothetical protein ACQERC_07080 [Bacteroidota bacterium]
MDNENKKIITLSSLVFDIIRKWKVFVVLGLLFGGIFFFYSLFKSDYYKSKSVVFTNFGNVVRTPYGNFKTNSHKIKDYLKILDSERFFNRGLQFAYSLESQDNSTIQFELKRERKDSIVFYFDQYLDQFFEEIDSYLKTEARSRFLVSTKNDIVKKETEIELLNKKIENLSRLDKMNSIAKISKKQFEELRNLGVSVHLNDLLSREHVVYDSVLVSLNMERLLTESEINILKKTEEKLKDTSPAKLFRGISFVNQVVSTYIPPEQPHRPVKANIFKKTILGVFAGLLIAFFVVFFSAVSIKSN